MKRTFLKVIAGSTFALALAPGAQAQVLANDPFLTGGSPNYTAGSLTGQDPTVTGFNGAWFQVDSGNQGSVSSTPISYSGTTGYATTAGAGALVNANQDIRDMRALDPSVTSAFSATSGTIYMSFELQLAQVGGYQAVELYNAPDGYRFLQLGYSNVGDFSNSTNFGITVNSAVSGTTTGSFGTADTNAHLFVLQLNLSSGGDTLNAWEDPTSLTGAAPTGGTEVSLSGFTISNPINDFSLGTFLGGSAGTQVSEIRIGDTLADITDTTGVPEPSTSSLTLLGLGLGAVFIIRRRMRA